MRNNNALQNNLHKILLNTITPNWQSYKQLRHSINYEMRKITGFPYFKTNFRNMSLALLIFDKCYPLEWKKEIISGNTIYFVRLKRWWK